MDELAFRDRDGVDVFYRRWLPTAKRGSVVLIAHGMSEHSGRYARVATALQEHGYAVYAPDHRGHGRTASSTGPGRAVRPAWTECWPISRAWSRSHTPTSARYPPCCSDTDGRADRTGIRGAQRQFSHRSGASGSPGAGRESARHRKAMRQAAEAVSPISRSQGSPRSTRVRARAHPFDWLSRDPAEVDAYLADPGAATRCDDPRFVADLCRWPRARWSRRRSARFRVGLPILLLTGEADPVSNGAANVRILEQRLRDAGLAVEAYYYPGARHEVLNELNRDEVERDLLTWIDRRVPCR